MTGEEYAIKKRRERQRDYYKKNREKIRERHRAYMREYRLKNSKPEDVEE